MPRLPRVTAKQIIRILEQLGFTHSRQSGSHRIYKNTSGKRATVPVHDNKILHPKIVKTIMTDAELSATELTKLLK
ncbi:MAG TPA: type II toxin-antitoxin system HicA family toxin [Candidatus Paceibacterota bacterium]